VAKVARVQQQLLLRIGAARRPERHARKAARETLDDGEQLEGAEGLLDQRVGARAVQLREIRAGEKHDRDVPRLRIAPQRGAVLETVDAGHEDVEHDHVGLARGDPPRSHRSTVGLVELEIEDLESRTKQCS